MNIYSILVVGAGGFLGSIIRYVTVLFVDKKLNSFFPYGTLAVNILGSFILGMVVGVALKQTGLSGNWKLFLTTGFCGGFTTFSAFSFENINLIQQRMVATSISYTLCSIVFGFLAVAGGVVVGKFIS